jgi:hypothetical protein
MSKNYHPVGDISGLADMLAHEDTDGNAAMS